MNPIILFLALMFAPPAPKNKPAPATKTTPSGIVWATSFSPIWVEPQPVSQKFTLGQGFVIGSDGVARSCPSSPTLHVYVRVEAKGAQDVFFNISDKEMLQSTSERAYTLICLRLEGK